MATISDDAVASELHHVDSGRFLVELESRKSGRIADPTIYKKVARHGPNSDEINVSEPIEIINIPWPLRRMLIEEMAHRFTALWGNTDPTLSSYERSFRTLIELTESVSSVFLVQYDRDGRLVSTASVAERDIPTFRNTGPNGMDLYGDHWIVNVLSVHRGFGFATEQIRALQKIARSRGWPHLWLYCRDEQDRLKLPDFYRKKLGFRVVGSEYVFDRDRMERENIMRFDTGV